MLQGRNKKGQFGSKSDSERKVRSIRVTDRVWCKFGEMADKRGVTRADLLEEIMNDNRVILGNGEIVKMLKEALRLKANAGGAIKNRIRDVLELLC